jgi:hypothetical protein
MPFVPEPADCAPAGVLSQRSLMAEVGAPMQRCTPTSHSGDNTE